MSSQRLIIVVFNRCLSVKVFYLAEHLQVGDAGIQTFAAAICAATDSESCLLGSSHVGTAPVLATFFASSGSWVLGGGERPVANSLESDPDLGLVDDPLEWDDYDPTAVRWGAALSWQSTDVPSTDDTLSAFSTVSSEY